jgi:uncharacterized protein YdeI (YjbR/CyaY-like superfamily)
MKAALFTSPVEFRSWLERHHSTATELLVGFYSKTSGQGGLTYPEALDEALCFGWIDGVRHRLDAERYTIRFTPRRSGSIWSNVNVRHVLRLRAAGRMHAAGLAAFARRDAKKTGVYSFEQRPQTFPAALAKILRANKPAWNFWQAQPPGYQRTAIWWVISAKRDATRASRLAALINLSATGKRLNALAPPSTRPHA